jgi:hypothetical protein
MNQAKITSSTLTITDPETGEKYVVAAEDVRAMVASIATDVPELGEIPPELRKLFADGKHTITLEAQDMHFNPDVIEALALKDQQAAQPKPAILEVGEVPAKTFSLQNSAPRGMVSLTRAQRRAQDRERNSKANRRARAQELKRVQKAMQAQIDAERVAKEQEALQDVVFADPRHVGKIVKVFEPIEKALHNFVDGEVATMEDGTTLLWATEDGCWYPAVACLRSVLETYAKLGDTFGWANHNAGLARVATLLDSGEPIHKADVDEALKTVEWMKYCTLTITPRQFTKEAVEIQIANELRDAGLAPEPTDADLTRDVV